MPDPSPRWPIPAAVILAIMIQTAGGLIWAGKAAARIDDLDRRMLEQGTVAERLTRVEEQLIAARAQLQRIEGKLERAR